jgi:hypothetical protein
MEKLHRSKRRAVLKLMATSSAVAFGGTALSGVGAADNRHLRRSLIDDLNVKNNDEVERTFDVTVYNTSGSTEQLVFSQRVTADVRELVSFENVFPRGKESRLDVHVDDGRTDSATASIVGTHPKRFGMEVEATSDFVDARLQHVDPGPADFVGGGE